MRKTLCVLLVLALICGFALSVSAKPEYPPQAGPKVRLPSVTWHGNAYIKVIGLQSDNVWFMCGWKDTSKFNSQPVGVNFGVFDLTANAWGNAGYFPIEWSIATPLPFGEYSSQCPLVTGHEYRIHLYIRDAYEPEIHSLLELNLTFIAP